MEAVGAACVFHCNNSIDYSIPYQFEPLAINLNSNFIVNDTKYSSLFDLTSGSSSKNEKANRRTNQAVRL